MSIKQFLVTVLFFVIYYQSEAQSVQVLNSNSQFTIVQLEFNQPILGSTQDYTTATIKGCTKLLEKGAPDIAKYTFSLHLKNNASPSIEVIDQQSEIIKLAQPLLPNRGKILHKEHSRIEYEINPKFYTENFYPSNIASLGQDYLIRNKRGHSFHVFPLRFQGSTNSLEFTKSITLKIKHNEGLGQNLIDNSASPITPQVFESIYKNLFVNYGFENQNLRYTPIEEIGSMLVLSPTQFISTITPFVQWKNQKGIATTLVNVDTLTDGNNITSIKNFISNFYNKNNNAFVVIVGDHTNIPTYNENGNNVNFYSYGDNGYAYIKGNDHYADVLIGRISGASENKIANQVNKIIAYEKEPNINGPWMTTCLAVGSNDPTQGDDDQYDWEHARAIADTLIQMGPFETKYELFDGTQGGLDAPGNVSAQDVANAINNGVSFFNYTGHGNAFGINTSGFNVGNISLLNNSNGTWPAMITVGCSPGVFVSLSCFAEEMCWAADANGKPKGTVINAMSTVDQYWDAPMQAQDEMNNIMAGVYSDNIKNTFGGIFFNGLFSMNDNYNIPGDTVGGSDMADAWQVFGDPSIVLRNGNKGQITMTLPCAVSPSSTTINIPCDVADATIAVTYKDNLIAVGNAFGGVATLNLTNTTLLENDSLLFTVTKYNHTPQFKFAKIQTDLSACAPTATTIKQNLTTSNSIIESEKKIKAYAIYNTTGQLIMKRDVDLQNSIVINFQDLVPNIYYIRTTFADASTQMFKVLKK